MELDKILVNVNYLEGSDVNSDGSIKSSVNKGKPVLLMMQSNYCPHCTNAKPAFQKLANDMGNTVCVATIQTDGGPSDLAAAKALKNVNTSRGVPAYLVFDKQGRFIKMHEGGRDYNSLVQVMSGM